MSLHDGQITSAGRVEIETTNVNNFPPSQRYKAKLVKGCGGIGFYAPTPDKALERLEQHMADTGIPLSE